MASTWKTAQSGSWNATTNWDNGIPNGADAVANFTVLGVTAAPWNIDLGGGTDTVGTLNVSASVIEHYVFGNGTLAMKISSNVRNASAFINVNSANTSSFSILDSNLTLDLLSRTTIDNQTAGQFDVSAEITGAGALFAEGMGTVRIDNSGNNWTGGLVVESGTALLLDDNVLGSGGALDVEPNAILDLNGYSQSAGNLSGGGLIKTFAGDATLTVNETVATTFSGTFEDGRFNNNSSATFNLTKNGAATLTLENQNVTQGEVTINQGAIALGDDEALSFYSSVDIASGASLDLAGYDTQIVGLSGTGSVVNSGASAHYLQLTGISSFSGGISGAVNIQLDEYASLTLSGANTYTGLTNVDGASVLRAAADAAFSSATSISLDTKASIDLNGFNESIGALTGSGTITNDSNGASLGIATFVNSGVLIYNGAIADGAAGGIVDVDVAGTGQLVLAGANTYSGWTDIEAGSTLGAGGENALSAASVIDVKAGGELDLAGYDETIGGLSDAGAVTSSLSGQATLTVGSSSFAGGIKNGAGVVALSVAAGASFHLSGEDDSTYTGETEIGANASLYADAYHALDKTSTLDISATGRLVLTGYDEAVGSLTGSGTIALTTLGYCYLTVDETVATTFSGQISAGPSGTGVALEKTGSATLTIGAVEAQAGEMDVEAGTLKAGVANAFTAKGEVLVFAGATLDLGGFNQSIGALSNSIGGGGTVTDGGAAATLTVSSHSGFFAGVIKDGAGAVSLSLAATAVEGLSGANTYSGVTKVGAGGELYAGAANAFSAASALSIGISGIVDLKGFNESVGAISGTGSITNGGSAAATLKETNAAASSFNGVLEDGAGALAFTKAGAGVLTLSGANTYSGVTTVSAGTLDIQTSGALGSTAHGTVVSSGATLEIDGDGLAIAEPLVIAGTGVANGGALHGDDTGAAGDTLSGKIQLTAAARINEDNPANAGLTISGTIVAANQNLTLGGAGALKITSVIQTGTGALTKDGTGTVTLSGVNTYSGATTVSAGTLDVQNSAALGVGAATVASGATLKIDGGNFTLAEKLTINSGATMLVNDTGAQGDTLTGAIVDNGVIVASGLKTVLQGAVSGTGTLQLSAGTILELGASSANKVVFSGAKGTLRLDAPTSYTGTISQWAVGDSIDLGATNATNAVVSGTNLIVTLSGGGTETFKLAGYAGDGLSITHTATGGSLLTDLGATAALTTAADHFVFSTGANTVTAAAGTFQATDQIVGGSGADTLALNGDYSAGVTFGATTLTNFESITAATGHSYKLALNAATDPSGKSLSVNANGLAAANILTLDAHLAAGSLTATGGRGADTIIAGTGAASITGGGGADTLTAGTGADTFYYNALTDAGDTINGFSLARPDVINLHTLLSTFTGETSANAFSAGYLAFSNSGGNTTIYVDPDGTAGADAHVALATLKGVTLTSASTTHYVL